MNNNLLKTASLSSLKNWSTLRFFSEQFSAKFPMKPLSNFLTRYKEPIVLEDNVLYNQITVKVRGNGVIKRCEKYGKDIGTKKQFVAREGQLIIASIDARNGAIGIIPRELDGAIVTNSFMLFEVSSIDIEYLTMILTTENFRKIWQANSSGTTNRQSVNEDIVLDTFIPVPSITEQERILKEYHELLDKAEAEVVKGDKYGLTLLKDIQSEVSDLNEDDLKADDTASILSTVSFTATDRWEVGYIYKQDHLDKINDSFKYDSKSISDLEPESLFGLSIKSSLEQKKGLIPMLRMTNIVNGEVDYSELKYVPAEEASSKTEVDKWILHNGDFLVTRTNGSKDLVGKAAVFKNTETFTYASYLIRYRFDDSIILTDYVNIMFLLPIVREQIAVMRRQGGGQYNLNSDEIGAIRIPVPSIPEQQRIIDRFNNQKDGANKYYEKAEELRKRAKIGFENEIFN